MIDLLHALLTASDPVIILKTPITHEPSHPFPKQVTAFLKLPQARTNNSSQSFDISLEDQSDTDKD